MIKLYERKMDELDYVIGLLDIYYLYEKLANKEGKIAERNLIARKQKLEVEIKNIEEAVLIPLIKF